MIALGTSGILISNEKDINGEWLWTTAIDSQGLSTKIVNAITINGAQVNAGKISSFDGSSWWNLDNNEFNFGDKIKFIDGTFSIELGNGLENLVTKEDLEEVKDLIDEVDGRLDTALGDIDRAFKEGIIGEVEKRVIEKTLKTLLDQYSNAEYLYEIYKVSENLTDETKTTLNARWRLYDESYTELTNYINEIIADEKCTETELVSYNLKVEEYYARYSVLKNLLEDCQIEASNNYTNTKVSISEGNIKTEIESKYVKVDEAVNYTIICDNEHQGIPVDMLRKPLTTNTYRFNIAIYKGGSGTQEEFTIDSITGTGSGITYTKYDKYITMKVSKDTAISDLEGSIDVALTCNGFKFNKKITWNAVLNGEKGDSAEVVSIEASSLIFKYNNETQVYSPTNITLNPVFKNCTFQSWKYSINGGITYNTLATIDGITKDTNNKLTISSTCALFTSSVTSIQFKVTSSVGTTDQVTLTRLRDGSDGLDGLPGKNGADGKTYYTWVKYADTPTSGMSELPDGKTYIGLAYNKETNVESTNYADYKWSLIKGENGLDGSKGEDGKTYYTWLKYADTPTSGMSDDPTNKKYMGLAYNKESKIESTNYADYSWSLIKGNDGTNAINVVLSNESHTFVADHYGCPIPTSITNNVYGYSGTKQVNTNIGEIIGLPEGMSITVKNNNTTNTQIIINVAETMRIESGTISIPVICNGVTINKVFTYSLAKNGVDAKIVVISATSQVFKSTDGGINYTPNSITVIASYQNCSHSKWQYSTNNDLTFRDLTNGTGGITVNGTTLTIPKTCSLFTSTTNCINIKAVGVDENVYDTVTIFKLLDRADINDVLDEQNSKITTVEEKYSTLEQDLDGFKTEVGKKYTTIEEFGQLEVGATNLIRNANFDLGLNVYWTTVDNSVTLLPPENDKPTSNILAYNVSGNLSPTYYQKWSSPIPIEFDENGVAEFIFRCEVKSADWSVVGDGSICIVRTFVDSDKTTGADCVEEFNVWKTDVDTTNNNWQTVVKRIKVTNNTAKYIRFGSYCIQNSNCKFREFMAVKGNRIASTFSINPSDNKEYVDGEIEDYTQTITKEYQSAIEQTANSITQTVSATYATKTELEQMVIGGGDNLLRNGNFADGLEHWRINDFGVATGTEKVITVNNTPSQWIPKNKNALVIGGLNTKERYGVESANMKLAPYTKYVISGYCAGHRVDKITVTMRDSDNNGVHVVSKDITPVTGGNSLSKWYRFEIPFTTTANGNYTLCLYSNKFNTDGSTNIGYVWFTDVQLEEGTKATPWKKCIYDITDAVDDVSKSVTNLNTYINDALEDKILDKTERQAIEQQLKVLEAEKTDINKEYTTLNSNAKLTGTPKTTLTTAYNDYISKYNALVTSINNILNAEDITVALKNSYNTAYTNHNNSLATYRQAYIDAFNSITTNYIETMKQALLKEIDDIQDSVDNLNDYVDGAFKDGILDNAEKHAIKQQLKTLSSEKADIDNEYTVVINDSDLTGTPKTNLTNAYNNYVSKYNSLVTSINNILNATLVTPTLRNSYDTAYTNHNSALATLKQRHTEAINAIAEAKVLDCTETITKEYKSAIEQTKNAITLSVSETYATKTEMEQIGKSGGDNLLRNGNFADGLEHWRIVDFGTATGTSKTIKVNSTSSDWIPKNKHVLEICGLNTNERYGVESANMKLAPYTKYVISGYCAGHRVDKITVTMRDSDNNGVHVISKDLSRVSGGNNLSKWYRFEIPFTTTANGNYSLCLYSRNFNSDGSTDIGYVWFTDVQVEQGTKATPWKKCIYDVIENIDDVQDSVDNLNAYVDGAFKDGILDETEKHAIREQLKVLSAEKADIDNEVTTVINNADLTGTPKTNLSSAYNDYLSKYIALTTAINNVLSATLVTPTLKESYNTAYNNHNRSLATLKQRHMEAIDAIAETKKQNSITTSKTYTDAQLTTTANAIRGTVSELREDFTDYQGEVSSTYATKGELELTSEQFKVTFQKSGSGNLLKNSDCQFGLNGQWVNNGGGLDTGIANAKPFVGSREPFFKTTFPNGMKYSEPVYLKPNTDYVYQAYVYVDSSITTGDKSPVHFWSWKATSGASATAGQAGLMILDYKQDVKVGEFSLCYIHFKTISTDVPIGFLPFIYSSGTVSLVAVKQICLKEGKTPSIWIPHSSEINEGITTINEHGIQVSHSNIKTKTRMTADGFYFLDENDDMFASLSSKDTWASLHVQEVFANNIENVYTGDANLYVDHSKTVAGKGSSLLPFNSFGILKEYLESMPIINKDLTINVQNPNAEINEVLSLSNLKGTGWIKIVFDKNCVLRSSEYAIRLVGINKFAIIEGGRTSYSSKDGATILDNGNQHGIFISDCQNVYIHSININAKNWGIRADRSRFRTRNVDFGQTYCAIELNENCQCYDGDSCGNCTDFVRAKTGSIFTYGASANGICPFGNKLENSGKIFLVGNARNQTGSYKYPSSTPSTPKPTTSTYTQTFKATSFKTYQYAWSNWGDGQAGGCIQGNWQSYGNKAGHVFFDLSAIRSFLGSGTVGSCTITLTRRNGGGVSGATNIYVNASSVTGASGTPAYSYNSKLGTLSWGESKTFNLSSNIVNALKSSAGSIAFYSSSDTGAYAEIVACSITLKVTK